MIEKIISGGQTGADLAGLDVAKFFGLETGGCMPFGFKTLDGCRPEYSKIYGITAHSSSSYVPRTKQNVKDSDGTVRLAFNLESAGEKCTLKAIKSYSKPYFDVDLNDPPPILDLINWIENNKISTLNVAGNSEQTAPGIYKAVFNYLSQIFETKDDGRKEIDNHEGTTLSGKELSG